MLTNVVRKFYANHWQNFAQQFNLSLDKAEFDHYGHCCGLRIPIAEYRPNDFKRLRQIESGTNPVTRVLLYGTRKIRITEFGAFVSISEETDAESQ